MFEQGPCRSRASRATARTLIALGMLSSIAAASTLPVKAATTPRLSVGIEAGFVRGPGDQAAAAAEAVDISTSFALTRVQSSTTCGQYPVPLSTYLNSSPPLRIDLLFAYATPCSSTSPNEGVSTMLGGLKCTSKTGAVTSVGAACWAATAYSFYKSNCPGTSACPEIEVLNEPGGSWFWGTGANSATSANAYASLLATTWKTFHHHLGTNSPKILASYDGGYATTTTWGQAVWGNTVGINVSKYVDGITYHPYGSCTAPVSSCTKPADNRLNISSAVARAQASGMKLPPAYVTEVGWNTNTSQGWWTEAQQANNICSFVKWAWSEPYVAQVIAYTYLDTGANWFGMVRWGEGSGTVDLSHKPAWNALAEAASQQPC
jgi:hypothetical protein